MQRAIQDDMAARQFKDGAGRDWLVWEVIPEELHPQVRAEAYLAQMYHTGWLVFETSSGEEKRRLSPVPENWSELPEEELTILLQRSELVPLSRVRPGQDKASEPASAGPRTAQSSRNRQATSRPDVAELDIVRTFQYPGGGTWTVSVVRRRGRLGLSVLRFASGTRKIELSDWPKDWADYREEQLVELLRRSAPRGGGGTTPADRPRRRWDDPGTSQTGLS